MLSSTEAYALARKLVKMPIPNGLEISTGVQLLLNLMDTYEINFGNIRGVLGDQIFSQVMAVDPKGPPPVTATQKTMATDVPPLQEYARLKKGIAAKNTWLDDALKWSVRRSPMTPAIMLESGFYWLIGVAIARRVCLDLTHTLVFPNNYTLWVASTSIYRKSTGLSIIKDLMHYTFPHLKLPDDNTPEGIVDMLSGKRPPNYDTMSDTRRKEAEEGIKFAGQRSMLVDEASTLFSRRDYMQGFAELLMKLYDAESSITRNLKSQGTISIEKPYLSVLGATTPSALSANLSNGNYEDGLVARFDLITPEGQPEFETAKEDARRPPEQIISRLRDLYNALPLPTEDSKPIHAGIDKDAYDAFIAYSKAVGFDMLKDDQGLDERLKGNYARIPMSAIRKALALATMDKPESPRITLAHWAKAQEFQERIRSSLHRALVDLNTNDDTRSENRVRALLRRYPQGMPLTEINRNTGSKERKQVKAALDALVESGEVEVIQKESGKLGGRPAIVYLIVES